MHPAGIRLCGCLVAAEDTRRIEVTKRIQRGEDVDRVLAAVACQDTELEARAFEGIEQGLHTSGRFGALGESPLDFVEAFVERP